MPTTSRHQTLPRDDVVIEEEEGSPINDVFKSPEQISAELVTLSLLPNSRWQHLLQIDIIKQRNKPKEPIKVPKQAPFFLPTIPNLEGGGSMNVMKINFMLVIIPRKNSHVSPLLFLALSHFLCYIIHSCKYFCFISQISTNYKGHVMFGNGNEKESGNKSAEPIVFSNPQSPFAKQLLKSHQTEDYGGTLALLKGENGGNI